MRAQALAALAGSVTDQLSWPLSQLRLGWFMGRDEFMAFFLWSGSLVSPYHRHSINSWLVGEEGLRGSSVYFLCSCAVMKPSSKHANLF